MRKKPAPLLLQQEVQLGCHITAISTAADSGHVAAGTCDAPILVCTADLTPVCTCSGHEGGTNGVAFLSGQQLASVGEDGHLRVWDTTSGQQQVALLCEGLDVDKWVMLTLQPVTTTLLHAPRQPWLQCHQAAAPTLIQQHGPQQAGARTQHRCQQWGLLLIVA